MQTLKDEAASWAAANQIRQYVQAALETARRRDTALAETKSWAEWAGGVADSLDPLQAPG